MEINKEQILGWALIILLLIGWSVYETKKVKEKKLEEQKTEMAEKAKHKADAALAASNASITSADTTATGGVQPVAANADSNALNNQFGAFAASAKGEEKLFVLENDVEKVTLSTKGGQIKSIELKKYQTWDKKPLILFTDKTNSLGYQFPIDDSRVIDTRQFYFEAVGQSFTVSGDSSKSFALRLNAGDGKYFEEKFTLKGNSYLMDYDLNLKGLNNVIASNNTYLSATWDNTLTNLEHNIDLERRYSALYYRYNESNVDHLDESKEDQEAVITTPLEWISYKQQFFNTTLFSKGEFQGAKLTAKYNKNDHGYVKQYHAGFTMPYHPADNVHYALQLFTGPNGFNLLASMNRDVESIIKLSPDFWMFSWIRYITRFIIWVFSWFNSTHLNYGIIILLMTLILKLVLHPLTAKSIESAAKMKILAPEIEALKEKYGDDQGKIGQEQMKLYNRAGVSPFGGCLPLLLQFPILMAMYYFFPASIELRQQSFLWATDLSSYDSIATFSSALPLIGDHISLFTILMTITSVLQAVMNNQMNAMANQQPGMKYMPYIMPVMLMFMFNNFPAALTYYYLLQNLLGVGHQWIIQKFVINDEKLRKQIEENKKNPKPASSWQKKLADMQKQAEQRAKQQRK